VFLYTQKVGGVDLRPCALRTPPPVFCKKRPDFLDCKGVDVFGSDQVSVRISE
jgi:hypothetical protein